MKKAILIGKGPSAVEITKRQGFDIVALNNAVSLCEVVDYLFINDFEVLDLMNEDDWKKVKSLVIPIIPQYNKNPHPTKNYTHFLENIPKPLPIVILHKLFKHQSHNNMDVPCYPIAWSVGTTAMQWMAEQKYSFVEYCGIDPGGGYKDEFIILDKNNNPINHAASADGSPGWYQHNYNLINSIAKNNKITLTRKETQ